jgi:hypothetical protein
VKTIVRNKKNISIDIRRHDFENEFAYLEVYVNGKLKDCFFAEKEFLFMDGTLKKGGRKYFFCPLSGRSVEKELAQINCASFQSFENLFYVGEGGEIRKINGDLVNNNYEDSDGIF